MNLSNILAILKLILPVPVIAIAGIAISIIIFYFKFSPVSSLTAEEIQIRLFSKEKRILVNLINYIVKVFIWSIILFSISLYFTNNKIKDIVSVYYENMIFPLILIEILFFLQFFSNELRNFKVNKNIKRFKIYKAIKNIKGSKIFKVTSKLIYEITFIRVMLVLFYTVLTMATFSILLAHLYNIQVGLYTNNGKIDLDFILAFYLITLLICLIIPFLLSPCINYLSGGKLIGNKDINIFILDDKKNQWYIYYPINKSYILLGNNKNEYLCSMKKIIKIEDISNVEIHLEKQNPKIE